MAWEQYYSKTYSEYNDLQKELSKLLDEFNLFSNTSIVSQLKNSKGKLTKKAVEAKLKSINNEDSEEYNMLNNWIEKRNKVVKVQKKISELKNEVISKIDKVINNKSDQDYYKEISIIYNYLDMLESESEIKKKVKEAETELDKKLFKKYKALTEDEIKTLVVDDKWMAAIKTDIKSELDRISQKLTTRIKEIAERYENTLPQLDAKVSDFETKVEAHLEKMGFVWK